MPIWSITFELLIIATGEPVDFLRGAHIRHARDGRMPIWSTRFEPITTAAVVPADPHTIQNQLAHKGIPPLWAERMKRHVRELYLDHLTPLASVTATEAK